MSAGSIDFADRIVLHRAPSREFFSKTQAEYVLIKSINRGFTNAVNIRAGVRITTVETA